MFSKNNVWYDCSKNVWKLKKQVVQQKPWRRRKKEEESKKETKPEGAWHPQYLICILKKFPYKNVLIAACQVQLGLDSTYNATLHTLN